MKKINKIITLILLLIFLTTYNPSKILFFGEEKFFFFQIENIEVINNKKIKKNEVTRRLKHIYRKATKKWRNSCRTLYGDVINWSKI